MTPALQLIGIAWFCLCFELKNASIMQHSDIVETFLFPANYDNELCPRNHSGHPSGKQDKEKEVCCCILHFLQITHRMHIFWDTELSKIKGC